MCPSPELISALRRAAARIERGGDYCWIDADRCNCGILAQEVLGVTTDNLYRLRKTSHHDGVWWDSMLKCEQTGRPLSEVFTKLFAAGFEREDIRDIENLSDPAVCAAAGLDCQWNEPAGQYIVAGNGRDVPPNVARYFRALADILEEQLEQEQNHLRQCGVSREDEKRLVRDVPPLPHSPSPMAELGKVMPCHHLYLADCCVYCGTVKQPKEGVGV